MLLHGNYTNFSTYVNSQHPGLSLGARLGFLKKWRSLSNVERTLVLVALTAPIFSGRMLTYGKCHSARQDTALDIPRGLNDSYGTLHPITVVVALLVGILANIVYAYVSKGQGIAVFAKATVILGLGLVVLMALQGASNETGSTGGLPPVPTAISEPTTVILVEPQSTSPSGEEPAMLPLRSAQYIAEWPRDWGRWCRSPSPSCPDSAEPYGHWQRAENMLVNDGASTESDYLVVPFNAAEFSSYAVEAEIEQLAPVNEGGEYGIVYGSYSNSQPDIVTRTVGSTITTRRTTSIWGLALRQGTDNPSSISRIRAQIVNNALVVFIDGSAAEMASERSIGKYEFQADKDKYTHIGLVTKGVPVRIHDFRVLSP